MKLRVSKDNIAVVLLAAICICLLSPAVARTVGDGVFFALTGLFIVLEFNRLLSCRTGEKNTLILIVLYIGMLFLYKFLGLSTASVSYHNNIVKFYIPFFCFIVIQRRLRREQILFLLAVCTATLAVTMLQNYRLKLAWGYRYSIQMYKTSGIKAIISTQYTGAIMLFSGVMFCLFLHERQWVKKVVFLVAALLCFAFNSVVTQRGIVLVLSIVMYPLLVLFNNRKRSVKHYVAMFLFIGLCIFVVFNLESTMTWIGEITGSKRIASRLISINNLLEARNLESVGGGSLVIRLRLTMTSINTFFNSLNHFVIGVGHRTDTNTLVGNHCQFVDEFARFGILGGLLSHLVIYKMLKVSVRNTGMRAKTILHGQMSILYGTLILRVFVGGIQEAAVGVVAFIVIPLFFRLMDRERKETV